MIRPALAAGALALLCFFLAAPPAAADVRFTILHFNDFHSRIEPDDEFHGYCRSWARDAGQCHGGIARMKTIIDQERSRGYPVLVLNAGDDFIGTLWDHHFKGKAVAHFMNQLGITAATLGNHDFDYGPDTTLEFVKQLNYPVVSGNLNANGHALGDYVKQYTITDVNGHKVGICGSTTRVTSDWSRPHPVYFEDEHTKARECVDSLKAQGVKIIIMLSHNGYNADKYLARKVPGLDIVVGGHSHAFLYSGDPPSMSYNHGNGHKDRKWGEYPSWEDSWVEGGRKVPVLQAGWASRYIGKVEVVFDDEGNLKQLGGQPILLGSWASDNNVPEDPYFNQQIAEWKFW